MTLFDLVIRSMRKNIKHYYLYFFALIFSVILYFVFATLQYDPAVVARSSGRMGAAFKVAGILLVFIAGIFIVYANAIFLKRRSREIGLYQLIGLTKRAVARLLIIENTILTACALAIGVGVGILVSRVFLLLLMKLVGFEGFIEITFSMAAIIQTIIAFSTIVLLTSIQMLIAVYRNTLLGLFNADKKGEHPKKPKTIISTVLAVIGLALIAFGYWLSGRMINAIFFINMLVVLASTILGTYLLFRVTISWVLHLVRSSKEGHLSLKASLSIAPLMHRMKGNANSLTIITVLSAMTLTMLAGAYSLYYSTEIETRYKMPFDFMFEEDLQLAQQFEDELSGNDIDYAIESIELLQVNGLYEKGVFPSWMGTMEHTYVFSIVSDQQLKHAGAQVKTPANGSAIIHDMGLSVVMKDANIEYPFNLYLKSGSKEIQLGISGFGEGNIVNYPFMGSQIVVDNVFYHELKNSFMNEEGSNIQTIYVFTIKNKNDLPKASELYMNADDITGSKFDFYTEYSESMENNGLLIFIAGFLGLVFLISTGSILYFKQMSEAEQEKNNYAILRQLGFSVQDILSGIVRKQIFVFGLPLLIGLVHSIFAIKSASFLFTSDISIPAAIAMVIYALIYLVFAFLTVGYYRKTVKAAL